MNRHSRREIAAVLAHLSVADRNRLHADWAERLNVGKRDQLEAATLDLNSRLRAAKPYLPNAQLVEGFMPKALRDRLDWILAGLLSGEIKHCEHITASPRMCFMSLWTEYIHCGCSFAPAAGKEEWTCDLCRVYHRNDCRSAILQMGPLAVLYGVCSGCDPTKA